MAYAEKRKGRLTGKWIGQRVRSGRPMRHYFNTKGDAEKWEAAVDSGDPSAIEAAKSCVPYPLLFVAQQARISGPWKTSRSRSLGQQLEMVLRHFGPNCALQSITTQALRGFVSTLSERKGRTKSKLSSKTINHYLSVVSRLLTFARLKGWTTHSPHIPWQMEVQRPIKVLSPSDQPRLLAALGSRRFQVVCEVFLTGALKPGELFSLRASQIALEQDWAWLNVGAGGDCRPVPLPVDLGGELQDLIRTKRLPSQTEFYQTFKQACRECGLDPDLTVTTLRQTALTRAGTVSPIHVLKEFAGQRSLHTTLRYVKPVTDEDIQKLASTSSVLAPSI